MNFEKAKWSNFNSIEPNIAKWLCYIHQIQKKKTVKNKNYQFLNFLSKQTDFGSEKRNRECEAKKGIKKKKKANLDLNEDSERAAKGSA